MNSSSDEEFKHGDYNDYIITPPPKKKFKALSAQQTRRAEKTVENMSPREEKRRAVHYQHPESCCVRKNCCANISESTVMNVRDRIWRDYGDDPARVKIEIAKVWAEIFLVNGEQCCINFLTNAFGVSKMFLYPDRRNSVPKMKFAQIKECIINYFHDLRLELDRMPDCDEYHVYAPKKADVYDWYMTWVGSKPCTRQYFLNTWKQVAPDVKLRKYLRFTKCKTCAELREVTLFKSFKHSCPIFQIFLTD